jgi:ribosomal protein S27AE
MSLESEGLKQSCKGCGSTVALAYHHDRDETLCAKCACERAMWDTATIHLRDLLIEPVRVWYQHWHHAGVKQEDLFSVFETINELPRQDYITRPLTALET